MAGKIPVNNRQAIEKVERIHRWELDKGDNTRLNMAVYLRLIVMKYKWI
jgi:hypothetical protein